jgi:hypothetical protein
MYDSAHENLTSLITEVINGLNFTGDPELTKTAKDLRKAMHGANASTLRTSGTVRTKSVKDVEKVLDKFRGVYGS